MNAFPVLSASSIASSGLPATATSRMTGISESSTRFAVTTDVAPRAETAPGELAELALAGSRPRGRTR